METATNIDERVISLSFEIDENAYVLTTSNYLKPEDEILLKEKIDKVNKMDASEIKIYYRDVLKNEQFSDKGGAGLGFIDMKKRSGNNLEYFIEKEDQNIKKYTLIVKVSK